MSHPRSPHYRGDSWEGPDYYPHVMAKMDRNLSGGYRKDFREEMHPMHGFPSTRLSPCQDQEERPRPSHDKGWAGRRGREDFQPHVHNYGDSRRPPPIPPNTHPDPPHRERLSPPFRPQSNPPHREMERGRGRGHGWRAPRSRHAEDGQTLMNPPMKKPRLDREEDHQPRFRDKEDPGGQRFSGGRSFSPPRPGTRGNDRVSQPVIFDHDHGFRNSRRDHEDQRRNHEDQRRDHEDQRRDHVDQRRDHVDQRRDHVDQRRDHVDQRREHVDQRRDHVDQRREHVDQRREHVDQRRDHMDQRRDHMGQWQEHIEQRQEHMDQRRKQVDQRQEHVDLRQGPKPGSLREGWKPYPPDFSQEPSRMWGSQLDERGDARKRQHQGNCQRSPAPQVRAERFGPSGSSMRSRGGFHPMNNRFHQNRGGRGQPHHGYQDGRREGFRPSPRTLRPQEQQEEDEEVEEDQEDSSGRTRLQQWHYSKSANLDQDRNHKPRTPRQKQSSWTEPMTKNSAGEETLTIRVDNSAPARIRSPLCYSSDRQLSLDLVNVGRQRPDFLPLLEHSGTYRERDGQDGTFAQEIITLVHQVKDQYFRGNGITLNHRFSAPQTPQCSGEEEEDLTLNKRFTVNRGFSLDLSSFLEEEEEEEEPLSSSLGGLQGLHHQPIRGPGDLRHDLERRRQERLEGVKVTIAGNLVGQRPPAAVRGPEQSGWRQQEDEWWEEPNRMSEVNLECKGEDSRKQSSYRGRNSRHPPSRPTGPLW